MCSLLLLAALPLEGNQRLPKWPSYRGAWFEIKYPPGFRARKSLLSNTSDTEYDSAFFTSPDKTVEFYVFSPLWNGEPKDIELDTETEVLLSQEIEQKASVRIRRVTIRAQDGSYRRSFEDSENTELNIRTVFGLKYRNQASFQRYRRSYLTFKRSLQKFSD